VQSQFDQAVDDDAVGVQAHSELLSRHSGQGPQGREPESIIPGLWLWIPGSPLRFATRRPGMTGRAFNRAVPNTSGWAGNVRKSSAQCQFDQAVDDDAVGVIGGAGAIY
jgi:hypothetical protein